MLRAPSCSGGLTLILRLLLKTRFCKISFRTEGVSCFLTDFANRLCCSVAGFHQPAEFGVNETVAGVSRRYDVSGLVVFAKDVLLVVPFVSLVTLVSKSRPICDAAPDRKMCAEEPVLEEGGR